MLVWIIVIVLLLLLLILPVGVDAAYAPDGVCLKLKLGPLGLRLFPAKPGKSQPKKKPERVKKPKREAKLKLTRDDIFTLLGIVFRLLDRLRKHLSIDRFCLNWVAAAADPCDAVVQYGAVNAGLSALGPLAHSVLNIREEALRTAVDFEREKPEIHLRLTATLQIWEILLIAICAGAAVLRWYWKKRREARGAQTPAAQKGTE